MKEDTKTDITKLDKDTIVSKQHAEILLKLFLNPNNPCINEVIRYAKDIFISKKMFPIHSDSTYRRYLNTWKNQNKDLVIYFRSIPVKARRVGLNYERSQIVKKLNESVNTSIHKFA